jgi:hypothetical protein
MGGYKGPKQRGHHARSTGGGGGGGGQQQAVMDAVLKKKKKKEEVELAARMTKAKAGSAALGNYGG